jgi:hypothetical protein
MISKMKFKILYYNMCNWIQAVIFSAMSWGIADTMFDIIVEGDDEQEDHVHVKQDDDDN